MNRGSRWIARIPEDRDGSVVVVPITLEPGQRLAPDPSWLTLEDTSEGTFIIGYTEDGECTGDTWQPTHALALEAGFYGYGVSKEDWLRVPDKVQDAVGFARTQVVEKQRPERGP